MREFRHARKLGREMLADERPIGWRRGLYARNAVVAREAEPVEHRQINPSVGDDGDWIEYKPSDTEKTSINGVLCRRLTDTLVKARIAHPDLIF